MKSIGIVICNYNKKDYVIKCIESIFSSSFTDFDLYVVDNASSDGSLEEITKHYSTKLKLLANKENLGGSGGFNTGLREVIAKDYKYLMLVDNDIVMDKYAIEESFKYLEANEDIAILGSKIYSMDNPERIQELGADIDFENFTIKPYYKNFVDDATVPEVFYCDYVPACSLMVRAEAVKKVGIMNETNFIYWDDIEWGYRFKKAGYKVAAYGKSKVWHKMGAGARTNTFATYYFWRNKIKFFAKYVSDEKREKFCKDILEELFRALYSCNYQRKDNTIKTLMYAYDDALNGVEGKAAEGKILQADVVEDRFISLLKNKESVLIYYNDNIRVLRNLYDKIKSINSNIKIYVCNIGKSIANQFENIIEVSTKTEADLELEMCEHIFKVKQKKATVLVDEYLNIIADNEDFEYCSSYESNLNLFIKCNYSIMIDKVARQQF